MKQFHLKEFDLLMRAHRRENLRLKDALASQKLNGVGISIARLRIGE